MDDLNPIFVTRFLSFLFPAFARRSKIKSGSTAFALYLLPRGLQARICFVSLTIAISDLSAQIPTTYVANIGDPNQGGFGVNDGIAESFATGANPSGYRLNSVSLVMDGRDANAIASFNVSLFSNSGAVPGVSLQSLSGDTNPGLGLFTYASSGLTLEPSTTYWIVASAPGNDGDVAYFWAYTWRSSEYTSSDGWFVNSPGYCEASIYQSEWVLQDSGGDGGLLQFSVNATAVPEPASIALLALVATLLPIFLRRLKERGQTGQTVVWPARNRKARASGVRFDPISFVA